MSADPIRAVTEESLAEAAAMLRAGGVVAFPTETVYGLGADATSEAAVRRIYEIKGRPPSNPLIVHVPDARAGQALAMVWSDQAEALAQRFWPGPLTLVVPRGARIPAVVSAGLPTLALRVPAHPVALRLLQAVDRPLAAPSANRSEHLSPTRAEHVRQGLPEVPLILDGGPCRLGIESTVVSLCTCPPRLLRPGALPLRLLRACLPELQLGPEPGAPAASPGLSPRHYAPRARLLLSAEPAAVDPGPGPVGYLLRTTSPPRGAGRVERLPEDPEGYAADLYAALHRLDEAGVHTVVVESPPEGEAWMAVRDRLGRACSRAP
ncbi:MAG: L-threonylcarbamoyladenylate synthase [Myxococcales bacterium]|nr:L-threonylcarbamoyladenylate synthase [Myxococcales bacterium]